MTATENSPADSAGLSHETEATEALTPEEALARQLVEAEARVAEGRDALLRLAAELDNVRKRSARENEQARLYGIERFVASILPVVDSLDLGLAAAGQADAGTLAAGQQATLRLLQKALADAGITELDPLGEPFDPQWHEAMVMQPSTQAAPDTVLQVAQKGYQLNGRLLRPARVIVARAADPTA